MRRFFPAVIAGLLFAAPSFAEQMDLTATATLDWSSLSIVVLDLSGGANSPTYNWVAGNKYGAVGVDAYTWYPSASDSDHESAADWTSTISADAVTAKAQSSAERTSTTLTATASSQSDTNPEGYGSNGAYAGAEIGGPIVEVSGLGVFVFAVDWEMLLEGSPGDSSNHTNGNAYLSVTEYDDDESTDAAAYVYKTSSTVGTGPFSGTLSVAIVNTGAPMSVELYAGVGAYSTSESVPEPTTFASMLGGFGMLLGWVLVRRRRK